MIEMTATVEGMDKVERFLNEFPGEMKDAIEVALFDIGQQGSGYAKPLAPIKTGNLRRSITFAGSDAFPFLSPSKPDEVPEMGGNALSTVNDVVYIGTNVVYAFPMEKRDGYMAETFDWLMDGEVERIFDREINRKLEGK